MAQNIMEATKEFEICRFCLNKELKDNLTLIVQEYFSEMLKDLSLEMVNFLMSYSNI